MGAETLYFVVKDRIWMGDAEMNILNRREILLTRRNDDLNWVTSCLITNDIKYITKTNSITNPGRHHGIPSIKMDYAYEYRVYIHKNDFERAKRAIRK